jgi:ADP-heptose:LPS heptosyltransferase
MSVDLLKIIAACLFRRKRPRRKPSPLSGVLVIFGGVIGDGIMFFDALAAMSSIYGRQGKSLTLLCGTAVATFMKEMRGDIKVKTIDCDMDRLISDYGYFKSVVGQLEYGYDLIITPQYSKKADLLARRIGAGEKLALRARIGNRFSLAYWLDRLTYTKHLYTEPDCMFIKAYKTLLHHLGDTQYKTGIVKFQVNETGYGFDGHKPYCAVCPTSREAEKSWDIKHFITVIDYITGNSALNVYICAGSEGIGLFEKITASVSHPSRLAGYINTPFPEWAEMIRSAEFCVGNDSASAHVAAFTGTEYIAVASGFHYGGALPYDLDTVSEDDALPIVVNEPMPCYGCYAIKGKRGGGTRECRASIKRNGRYLCIESIPAERVINVINLNRTSGASLWA